MAKRLNTTCPVTLDDIADRTLRQTQRINDCRCIPRARMRRYSRQFCGVDSFVISMPSLYHESARKYSLPVYQSVLSVARMLSRKALSSQIPCR